MQTLYQRIGGRPTIDKLITKFYVRIFADPMLGPFFVHTSIEKLTRMQQDFFSIALGGPEPSAKISLFQAHRGRGIERKHLTRFTDHLIETLGDVGINETEAGEIVARIATYADEVLGEASVDG